MKVFSIGGYTQSGKTTTVINLTRELKRRGYRVVTIKDIHAQNFSMESEGTDTWKHWESSSDVVFARGEEETYQIWHKQLTLNEMLEHISADYVIIEGMKKSPLPKIICASTENELRELVDGTTFAVSGVITNDLKTFGDIPLLNTNKEIAELADLVEEKVFKVLPYPDPECCGECGLSCRELCSEILKGNKTRKDCVMDNNEKIRVSINSKKMKLVPFVQKIISDVIISLLQNLKGYEKGNIEIKIDNE